jgi:hypothetical protein
MGVSISIPGKMKSVNRRTAEFHPLDGLVVRSSGQRLASSPATDRHETLGNRLMGGEWGQRG